MRSLSLHDQEFDRLVTLRESYRIMGRFLSDFLGRGDTEVSYLLHIYAGLTVSGDPADPAAPGDYLDAARVALGGGASGG